jgi:hypothetical protein
MLNCMGAAQCSADCQWQAQLKLDCPPPMATVSINGNDALSAAFNTNLAEIGDAVNETAMLAPASVQVIGEAAKLTADFGAQGAVCLATEASAAVNIQASVTVSVNASATVSGSPQ